MPRSKAESIPPPRVAILPGHGGLITTLNDNDVLSGRGGRINNHPGNIAFRTIVEDYKRNYLDPRTKKLEKVHVAAKLVAQIRSMNPPGRFLKEDGDNPGKYIEIGDQRAWKKAGQALREDAPEIRKEIDEELEVDQYTSQPVNPYSRVPVGIPPSVSYSPSNAAVLTLQSPAGHRPDPPESEGVTGYRQPPLPYHDNDHGNAVRPMHYSGRGPPPPQHHYLMQQHYPPNQMNHPMTPRSNPSIYYAPPNPHHYPPQPYPHQPYPQSQYPHQAPYDQMNGPAHNYFKGMHPPPQRQPQFTSGPRNRFGAPVSSSDRRGDFPSLAMSTATDFTMSDVSEFTPVTIDPDREKAAYEKESSLDYLKESTQPLEAMRHSSSDKSSLAVSELSMSGFKASALIPETPERNESNLSMSLGLSRTYSFPDLFLSTGELATEPMIAGECERDNSDPSNGTKHKKTKSGRLFRQQSSHRHSSSETSSIFSVDSLKMGRGFHPVRGRTNTDVSGLQDAMSLMSMDHQSVKSETSWLEAAKSMQSITSDMNPWASTEGNSLRHINGADDGSVRSLLSDMSNDLNALDLAEIPLLPPIQHTESGFEDSASLIHRPDP